MASAWRSIGALLDEQKRPHHEIVVLWMPSHLDLAEAKRRGIPQHFLIGNTVVDELAGASALEARLSESVRARILE
eukprot:6263912-Pyramimonas_sp.AAC.1